MAQSLNLLVDKIGYNSSSLRSLFKHNVHKKTSSLGKGGADKTGCLSLIFPKQGSGELIPSTVSGLDFFFTPGRNNIVAASKDYYKLN